MLEENKRKELLALAENNAILAVRAWKRRSTDTSIVIDAEADAKEEDVFTAVNKILKDAKFKWAKTDQKKNYVQNEYSYKGDGYTVKIVFISLIKKAV